MSRFIGELVRKIRHFGLDNKTPAQTKTKTDWRQILMMAEHGMLSEKMAKMYLHIIETDIEFFSDFPDFLHRLPAVEQLYAEGRPHVRLGSVVNAPELEFGIRFDGPLFILCAGLIGFGKTTVVRVLLQGVFEYNLRNPKKKIVVIVFDRKGGDYADLAAKFGWKHFHVYNSLRLSLENPEGMPPEVWINILAHLFCDRARLQYSEVTIANALRALLGLLNPKPTRRLIWPDFQLLLDFLKSLPETTFSTKAEYSRSLKQQLEGITQSSFKTYNAFQGFRVEDFIEAGQSVIIAMPNMEPPWSRQLFTDIVFSTVLKGRIERSHRVNSTEVLFVADEFDSDVDAQNERLFSSGMSCPSEIFKLAREFGIGACYIVSSLRSISQLVRENATMHLMFRTSDSRAAAETAATLQLPPYGELTLGHLGKGQCLAKQIGPWPHAMKVQVDYMPPSRVHVTKYDTHPYIPSKRLWEIPAVKQFVDERKAAYTARKEARKSKTDNNVSQLKQLAMKLLQLRASNPYVPVVRLFECLGDIHHRMQKRIREHIEREEWARFEEIRIGRSNRLLMDITAKGFAILGLAVPNENKGRGGIAHRHFAHWIKLHFENKGFKAYLERVLGGTSHPVDISVQLENGWSIFEICVTAFSNILSHIKSLDETTDVIESLTIVVTTKTQLKEVKRFLQSNMVFLQYAGKIKLDVIENYIVKELKNETT